MSQLASYEGLTVRPYPSCYTYDLTVVFFVVYDRPDTETHHCQWWIRLGRGWVPVRDGLEILWI